MRPRYADLIYQDSEDDEYASIEFAPTWFDSAMVHGSTRLDVNFHLPPGVTSEEPRYHDEPFTEAYFEDDRVVYSWVNEDARGDRKYVYGASFPKEYLAEGVVQTAPAFTFPDLSGCCSSPVFWIGGIAIGWAFLAFMGNRSQKQRRMKYMPPALAVEGTGVKRGLTAVEAAILLEAPLDKVITMILFGLVKKGIITVESEKPLKVKAQDPLPKDAKLWYYERRFLDAIGDDGKPVEGALREMIIDLIGDVNKKLTGFSRNETKAYYKDIAARAWQQVEASDTPEVLGERWGEGLEWTMLDDDWDDRTREVFRDRPVVIPHWWWFYRPWGASTGHARPSTPMPGGFRRWHPGDAAHPARRRLCQHGGQRRREYGEHGGQRHRELYQRDNGQDQSSAQELLQLEQPGVEAIAVPAPARVPAAPAPVQGEGDSHEYSGSSQELVRSTPATHVGDL